MSGTGRRSSSRGARRRRSARRRRGGCSRARWTARSPRPCPRPPRTRSPSPRRRSCEPARAPFVLDLGLRVARRRRRCVYRFLRARVIPPEERKKKRARARVSPGGPVVPRPCPCPCLPRVCIFCEPRPCPAPALSFLSFLPRLFTLLSLLSPNSARLLACVRAPSLTDSVLLLPRPLDLFSFYRVVLFFFACSDDCWISHSFLYILYLCPPALYRVGHHWCETPLLRFFWPACLVGYIVDWMQMRRGDARALFLLRLLSRVLSA